MIMVSVEGKALLQSDGGIVTVHPEELLESTRSGGSRQMGDEMQYVFTYVDDAGRSAEWTASEYPSGILNNVSFYSDSFEVMENFDFDYTFDGDDELAATREEAVDEMVTWFLSKFQDPAQRLPYNSREGGYQWVHGGPYDASEQLHDNFGRKYPEALIEEATEEVTSDGIYEWDSTEDTRDYDDRYDSLEEDDDLATISPTTLQPPGQSQGPRWTLENGRAVPMATSASSDPLFIQFHAQVRDAAQVAMSRCATLQNKFPNLWSALVDYSTIVSQEPDQIDEVKLYVFGLQLRSLFDVAKERGARTDEPYPEVSKDEDGAIQNLILVHGPFVQMTETGAYLTDLANRELQTPQEAKRQCENARTLALQLAKRPDVVDADAMRQVVDFATVSASDPQFTKKTAFSLSSLRNITIVLGIGSILVAAPTFVGAAVGGTTGGIIGAGAGFSFSAILRPAISETDAGTEAKGVITNLLNRATHGDMSVLAPMKLLYRSLKESFRPTVENTGIEIWFNSLHSDLDRLEPSDPLTFIFDTSESPNTPNEAVIGLGFSNYQWAVDEEGLMGVGDNDRELSIKEVFAVTGWQEGQPETVTAVYHLVMHFAGKSWCDIDALIEAWANAFVYHGRKNGRNVDPVILEQTLLRATKGVSLNESTKRALSALLRENDDRGPLL